jgi:hypothetical protein
MKRRQEAWPGFEALASARSDGTSDSIVLTIKPSCPAPGQIVHVLLGDRQQGNFDKPMTGFAGAKIILKVTENCHFANYLAQLFARYLA